ncbi:hypothetical protein [Lachnoclostridium sp.]|uniref:hypothetical protein n=1 Tax=Lachnoclostridium sp. TaxID=2028282 RepID=UPI002897543E|nr:hypothetical protein [Lachnoclostridium sp.]
MQNFNPFDEKPIPIEKTFMDWRAINPCPYNKEETDAYTKTRIVLMNGTEFEAQWFSRNFSRHCPCNDLRRELAILRRVEQQQQKLISCLKPRDESILEHTITYEQLAVDLTSVLAKQEPDCTVRNALNFALLEDFDHLFRYSNLLDMEYGICPEKLVGGYTEIMPARPTISEHRHPIDSIFPDVCNKEADILTKLNIGIITAAEQQTMNYYMNVAPLYDKSDLGRRLYQEIGLIEEQHVSQYESLKDTTATWLEDLLLHEYTECYLYYSNLLTETDPCIRSIWEEFLCYEIAHLHKAKDLLCKYEGKDWQEVIPCGTFPQIVCLRPNIDYVRAIIETTTGNTQSCSSIVPLGCLDPCAPFFRYQDIVNHDVCCVPSHNVIDARINCKGKDYRFQTSPHPLPELRNRCEDNTSLARIPECTPFETSECGTTDNCCQCKVRTSEGTIHF